MKNKNLKYISFITTLLLLSSCGVWTNFTTYFNRYYNAKTLFDRSEEEILKQRKDVFAFREEKIPQQLNQDFIKVIEKCSKIFQFDKESSYFDDALFITGKAFYYQQEYASAQRKFLELASIPESDYKLENKLWLAKTYLQLRSFDEGLGLIEEIKSESLKEDDEEIFINASITKIGFFIYREEHSKSVEECNNFLNAINDEEVNALISYQLGKIYLLLKDEEKALEAFTSVMKYSPTFEIEFESRFEQAQLLKTLGRVDESESAFIDLQNEGKFKNQLDRVLIEIGKIYYDKKEDDRAIQIFKDVDSTYKLNPTSGIASMMLGEIYQQRIGDYDSSYKYYNKAAFSLAPIEIRSEAQNRVGTFNKYFNIINSIKDYDLQILYITKPEIFYRDSIDYDIAYKQYEEEFRKTNEQLNRPVQFNAQPSQDREQPPPVQQQLPGQQLGAQQQQPQNPNLNQKRNRNEQVSLVSLITQGKAKKPARPYITVDSVYTLLSQELYNLGNIFFSEFEVRDSSYIYFTKVLEDYPNKPAKVQTLYALGTYYETVNQKEKADSLFKIIYDNYPKHQLYNEAAKKLGLIKREEKKIIITDDPAEELYITAEEKYYNKNYQEALKAFRNIFMNYSTSTFVPKSIYYAGLIHEELKQYDSAAFFYGILSSKEYANTPYGKAVIAKYTEFKNEKERLEKEEKAKLEIQPQQIEKVKTTIENKNIEVQKIDETTRDINHDRNKSGEINKGVPADSLIENEGRRKKINVDSLKTAKADTTKKQIIKPEK